MIILIDFMYNNGKLFTLMAANFVFSKRGLVEEIYNELFDLILDATKCPYHEDKYDIYLFEEVYGFFRRIPNKTLTVSCFFFSS